ncbi:hypothetical protein Cmaq_0659 [Caldivirga maquilingensis IC-167]|uniref:Uncharacterized protein n=1 Tax=Caldivirga maquilingensis (strain ATCC 700844 / DSM 13496 / JCM 10307 / IC-167) TaxID=397948 RepID=A8MCJ3_CALMQ|nr:hypothetical protein Cmaq_0659 [Caldivirga maquilingensis IC-167]
MKPNYTQCYSAFPNILNNQNNIGETILLTLIQNAMVLIRVKWYGNGNS